MIPPTVDGMGTVIARDAQATKARLDRCSAVLDGDSAQHDRRLNAAMWSRLLEGHRDAHASMLTGAQVANVRRERNDRGTPGLDLTAVPLNPPGRL
jgi:hypothetical protein